MRIAVLVKQVPQHEDFRFEGGRIVREGTRLEVSAYCRRANAKAVELAGEGGEVVVFTMGPPTAEDALREMLACGADRGVHLCHPAFAGSDTLATARALAAALRRFGPFDLVLTGLNSVDADTGQVGPEIAELMGLPFAPGARELSVDASSFQARLETDFGYRNVSGPIPAVVSCAERLTSPSKADPQQRAAVNADLVTMVGPSDLGVPDEELGAAGSPTTVGPVRVVTTSARLREQVETVGESLWRLRQLGALDEAGELSSGDIVPPTRDGPRAVWCFAPSYDEPRSWSLLNEAALIASKAGGTVTALTPTPPRCDLGPLGADRVVVLRGAAEPEQWAQALGDAAGRDQPWAFLVEGSPDGRLVASTVAARYGWGLVGDAVSLEYQDGRLAAWKPAFAGDLQVLIHSRSPVQMATIRPGILARRRDRTGHRAPEENAATVGPARVKTSTEEHFGGAAGLVSARRVVCVGAGVDPAHYPAVEQLCASLGAELAATRKVTDQGWLPRSRQVGLTGRSVAPRLYIALGVSGRYNHTVGFRHAQFVLAVNRDLEAPIFNAADIGIVGDCETVVKEMLAELSTPMDRQ